MNSDPKLAKERLQSASHRKDKVKRWGWLMVVGAVVVLAMVGFATMDYWLMLPPPLRYGALAALAFLAGLGGWGLRRLLRKPTALKEAALDAEAQQPDLGCIVSTAAEYASGRISTSVEYEPELAAALQAEAAKRLEKVALPYRRKLVRPISALGISLAIIVIFVSITPGAWTALKRIVFPWIKAQYTDVAVKPGDVEVRAGQDVEIASVFSGRPPREPKIYWQQGENPVWQTVSLKKSDDGSFVYPLKNVTVAVKYHVTGGDAVSPDFQVTPYLPPEVKDFSLGLAYPDYTKLKPVVQSSPEITILRGSTAAIHVRANVELSRARIRFSDTNAPPLELRRGDNELWTGTFKITKEADYTIELFDQKGRQGEDQRPHHIAVTADAPPKVEILEPAQDMRADATNKIPVKISVADDYGVAEIKLVFHKLNSHEQIVLCPPQSEKNGEVIATGDIDLATLGLKRYDVVAYHAEAKDNNTLDGPGIGRSALYFIEITDKESNPSPPQQGKGEQVNLLVVQKQIVAETVALTQISPSTNFVGLALREKDAVELARTYLETLNGAPSEAISEMQGAITALERATGQLEKRDRNNALPPEEEALARLYHVLALLPELKALSIKPKPQEPKEQKPQLAVSLQEIKKKKPEEQQVDAEIAEALEDAKELSRSQAELNETGQKLAQANRGEGKAEGQGQDQGQKAQGQQAKGKGQANAKGQGEGEGQGQGQGEGNGENQPANSEKKGELAKQKTNNEGNKSPELAKAQKTTSPAEEAAKAQEPQKEKEKSKTEDQLAKNESLNKEAKPPPQLAQLQKASGNAAKTGKGQGKGKGKGKGGGQKGKGKGQGTQPGDGSGKPSDQRSQTPQEMAPSDLQESEPEPQTPEELAQKEEELSQEAQALAQMLERLAGKGTRVGHNLARSANKASEHMEGAAQALKQGNAAGAGMRGTQSSAELEKLVDELERIAAKRPDLTDVASEEAPKEFEAFISEYFKKLSYEK